MKKREKIFRIVSIVILAGLTCYYSYRLIHHYNKFKQAEKTEEKRLGTVIKKNNKIVTSGDGLYNVRGSFVFKGKEVNNYLSYSNIVWRIIKVDSDSTIKLIVEDPQVSLMYGDDQTLYKESNIRTWLNKSEGENTGIFENVLNTPAQYLSQTYWCNDTIKKMEISECKEQNTDDKISLLGYDDYLNSNASNGYLNNGTYYWLANSSSKDSAWYITKDGQMATDDSSNSYGIRPVITINNKIDLIKGDGTKDNPYVIESDNNNQKFGSYYKLGNDVWRSYSIDGDTVKLVLDNYYKQNNKNFEYSFSQTSKAGETAKFDITKRNTLPYYLNGTYYNSLSYKNSLIACDWYNGSYGSDTGNDYQNIYTSTVKAKVGLLNAADIIINRSLTDYFTMTSSSKLSDMVYIIKDNAKTFGEVITEKKSIRPTICIDKNNVKEGNGTSTNPFIVG